MKADVDIDLPGDFDPAKLFPTWTRASQYDENLGATLKPHPCGYYPQAIATDPLSGLAAIPYDHAEELGYLKLDFLHLNIYSKFESREEIEALVELEPNWDLLLVPSTWPKLFQLSRHNDLLLQLKPRSIEDLADVMALIRPGKRELAPLYLVNKAGTRASLYRKGNGYAFKKSHSVAYALVVVLQLHLIEAGLL